ncbi:hypothetical protein [Cytobacillus horneckiae]|uniref:hypothetical protein n=1 Tax=Cytobacillus horneckiae TaxID=549687 RepID=UPI0034CF232A
MVIAFAENEFLIGWIIGAFFTMYLIAFPVSLLSDLILKIPYLNKRIIGLVIHAFFAFLVILIYSILVNGDLFSLDSFFLESVYIVLLISIIYWLIDELLRKFHNKVFGLIKESN